MNSGGLSTIRLPWRQSSSSMWATGEAKYLADIA